MNENRGSQVCAACGTAFGCGAKLDGCWCTEVKLTDAQAAELRERFDDCLCPSCLGSIAARPAIKVIYPDKREEIVAGAVRVDQQNFHEGMYDFYDEGGNLLRQIDMGSGITWSDI
jgi:hypothetical protein